MNPGQTKTSAASLSSHRWKQALVLTLAIVSALALIYTQYKSSSWSHLEKSINALIVILVSAFTIKFQTTRGNFDSVNLLLSLLSLSLAFAIVVGSNIDSFQETRITSLFTWIKIVLISPGFYLFFCSALSLREDGGTACTETKAIALRYRLIMALVIFVCWIPVFVAFYPGIYGYDSIYQTYQILGDGTLNPKHPVLHTLFLSGCIALGQCLFGSAETGFAIHSLVQMCVLAIAFAGVCCLIGRISASKLLTILSVAWFALCPLNSLLAISSTKDTLFTAFTCFMLVTFFSLLKDGPTKCRCVSFFVTATLCLLLRNNAIYAYFFLLVCVILLLRKDQNLLSRKKLVLVSVVSPLVVALAITGPLYGILGIKDVTSTKESLSVPIQQMARVASTPTSNISEEQRELIHELLPHWEYYSPGISDPVKNYLNTQFLYENKGEVLVAYIQIGMANPIIYLDSFILNTYGYWFPHTTGIVQNGWGYHPFLETSSTTSDHGSQFLYVNDASKLPLLHDAMSSAVSEFSWSNVPILSTIVNPGTQIWYYLIGLVALLLSAHKSKVLITITAFICGYWITCLLGPCLLVRYMFPLYSLAPVLIASFFSPFLKNQKAGKRDSLARDDRPNPISYPTSH